MFPDEFPFNRREPEASAVEATPIEAPAERSTLFPDGFPFNNPEPQVQAAIEAAPQVIEAPAAQAVPAAAAMVPAPLPFKERRRSPRQRMAAKATLRVDTVGGNPIAVEIDNLSLLGVRFRVDRALTINDKANIRLEVGPLKWSARLRVINCIEGDGAAYTIGCEFVGNELARSRAAA